MTLVVVSLVVRRSSCSSASTYAELAVQTLNHFARKIAVDLEVLDWDIQTLECVAEVEARGVELSDVLVGEGESERRVKQLAHRIPCETAFSGRLTQWCSYGRSEQDEQ